MIEGAGQVNGGARRTNDISNIIRNQVHIKRENAMQNTMQFLLCALHHASSHNEMIMTLNIIPMRRFCNFNGILNDTNT